jgi:hypothetical protein
MVKSPALKTMSDRHASLEEIVTLAERKFRDESNSRLFAEQLFFMDDVRDYQIDFVKTPLTAANITTFLETSCGGDG